MCVYIYICPWHEIILIIEIILINHFPLLAVIVEDDWVFGLLSADLLVLATQPLPCRAGTVFPWLVPIELVPVTSDDEQCTGSTNFSKKM